MRIFTMCIFLIKHFTNHPFCVYIINSQRISCNIYIKSNISCLLHTHQQCPGCSYLACLFTGVSATYVFQWNHLTLQVSLCVNTAARQTCLGCKAHCSHKLMHWNIVLHNLNCLTTTFRVNYVVNCNTGSRKRSRLKMRDILTQSSPATI